MMSYRSARHARRSRPTDQARPVVDLRRLGSCIVLVPAPGCDDPVIVRYELERLVGRLGPTLHLPWDRDDGRLHPFGQSAYAVDTSWGDRDGLVLASGYEPIVVALLDRAGFAVHRAGRPPAPLGEPDRESLRRLGPTDEVVLDFVRQHDRGQIRYAAGAVDPLRLVAQVALAYPDRAMAVMARREEEVVRAARRLAQDLGELVPWGIGRSTPPESSRVIVSTPRNLGDYPGRVWAQLPQRTILIALDAIDALGPAGAEAIQHARAARVYGLLDQARQPTLRQADLLIESFGLHEMVVPRHGCVPRPIKAVITRLAGGRELPRRLDALDLKRSGLWNHDLRNRRLARLARALADGEHNRLETEAPTLAPLLTGRTLRGIAVLVESLEQALALAPKLTGWPLVTGPEADPTGLPRSHRRLLAERTAGRPGPARGQIITFAGLAALDLASLDAIVRADGGLGVPPALDFAIMPSRAPRPPLLLIDLDDRHHPALRRRARTRIAAYEARGWLGGLSPLDRAIAHYLATRPELILS